MITPRSVVAVLVCLVPRKAGLLGQVGGDAGADRIRPAVDLRGEGLGAFLGGCGSPRGQGEGTVAKK